MEYKYTVLTNTTIGAFMSQLDGNIVLIALPTITRTLHATAFEALWVLMGYILMTAVLLLLFGRLADMYGKVRLYNLGFAVFTIGSGLCSLSISGTMLVFFRLVQGVGAALIWANNAAILTDAFPPNERGRAIGVNLVAGISGSVIGLILGGVLTVALGWQSIFWINLPIGVFATIWAHKKLRELGTVKHERIDLPGNLLFAGGLSTFLVGLTLGALSGYTALDFGMMVAGLVALAGFGYVELKTPTPLMDLKLFKIRPFTAGIFSNFLASISRSGISLVLTIFFQGALLYDALKAGILLIPFAVAFVTVGPLSGFLSDKYGARGFTTGGLLISTGALFGFAAVPGDISYNILALLMVVSGAGGGMFVAPNISSIMNATPVTRRGVASGMSATLVTTGALLSLAIVFVVLATSIPLNVLQAVFAGETPAGSNTSNVALFVGPMHTTFLIMGIVSLIAVVPSAMRGQKFEGVPESKTAHCRTSGIVTLGIPCASFVQREGADGTGSIRKASGNISAGVSLHSPSTVISWPSLVRLAAGLRLPFWLWAIIIGFVPTRLLATLDYLIVPPAGLGGYLLDTALVLSFFLVYFVYAIHFISNRMERLNDYVKQMSPDVPIDGLRIPFRLANILAVWVILLVAITLLFGFPSATAVFSEHIAVIAYFFLILASFLWVYGYSMYAIHRAGKLPLRLKPFTEDRTLGLKPFGTTSLRLAGIYAFFPVTLTILELVTVDVEFPGGITVIFSPIRLTDIVFSVGLILAGIALFFLPLLSIRKKLQEAKHEEQSWVTPQYTAIITRLKEQISKTPREDSVNQTQALADELTMVRQIQQDIQKIQSWPFDLGVVSRLATVLAIPPILGVLARILILVFLHL